MLKPGERRRFPRLDISEEARVYDENGRELGKVAQVSGGGMNIAVASPEVTHLLESGRRLRITVVEPGSRATNVLDVHVRGRDSGKVGMQFLEILDDKPL